jgi:hypothetical protein
MPCLGMPRCQTHLCKVLVQLTQTYKEQQKTYFCNMAGM